MQPKSLFYLELAKLLKAGIGIREAMTVVMETRPPQQTQLMAQSVIDGISARKSITESLAEGPIPITELEHTIISAGERGGSLAASFKHLGDYFAIIAKTRKEMMIALIYPFILLHVGLLIAAIPSDFLTSGITLGTLAKNFVTSALIAYVVIAILFFLVKGLLQKAPKSAAIDSALNKIPLLGGARKSMALARFTKVYHSCILAAIPMVETVTLSSDAAQSGTIAQAGKKIADTARSGHPLGPTFIDTGAFPPSFARSYSTAETAGALDEDLARWAEVFQEDAFTATRRLSTTVPKLLYALVVFFVLWRIISFYLNYLSSLDTLF